MWWEIVGCDRPTGSVRSQTHISPALLPTIIESSFTRVGSPRALKTFARSWAVPSSIAWPGVQQESALVSMVTGSAFMALFCPTY